MRARTLAGVALVVLVAWGGCSLAQQSRHALVKAHAEAAQAKAQAQAAE